eukprot:scaffold28816_cov67-Phaeocystis_antarctica.AAC.4
MSDARTQRETAFFKRHASYATVTQTFHALVSSRRLAHLDMSSLLQRQSVITTLLAGSSRPTLTLWEVLCSSFKCVLAGISASSNGNAEASSLLFFLLEGLPLRTSEWSSTPFTFFYLRGRKITGLPARARGTMSAARRHGRVRVAHRRRRRHLRRRRRRHRRRRRRRRRRPARHRPRPARRRPRPATPSGALAPCCHARAVLPAGAARAACCSAAFVAC